MSHASLEQQVAFERIQALYRNVPAAFVAAMTVSLYLVGTSWQHVAHGPALAWLTAMLLMQLPRFGAYFAYRRARAQINDSDRWARRYQLFIALSGCIWALSPFVFMKPGDPITHAMVMMGMYGLGAGVVPGLAYLPAALRLFLLLVFLPLVLRLLLLGGAEYAVLAAATFLFMGVLMGFGRNTARTLETSIRVRFENQQLMEKLRREKEIAESASRAKSQFFAAASHDLRQPLHALGLYASALRGSALPGQGEIVERMEQSVQSLESLFDELLDISKLDAGIVVPRLTHFTAAALLEQMQRQFSGQAQEKGLQLRLRDGGAVLHSDRTLLARILGNLVSNAVRYSSQGGVLVGCRRRGDHWLLEVWDTGCGIAPPEQGRVFEEFYQLHNPERDRRKGLGLGLATVARLSSLLKVPLTLHSRPGRGSVFRLQVASGDAAQVESPGPAAAVPDLLAGRRIAVIDDELAIRDSMQRLLTQWRCEVMTASSADDLVAQQNPHMPELIIADHRLAGGANGIDAIERLQQVYGKSIPALLITGDTSPERMAQTQGSGWPVLLKPVRPVQLRAACSHLLAGPLP